jgi:histidinol-phosphate phosphatase family protein
MQRKLPWSIDRSWTLFLDRDGVINKRIVGDYVKTVEAFAFLPGIPEAIARLSNQFGRLIVVTNQQGIGKGLYTSEDLNRIHDYMLARIKQYGGHIDAVYHSPNLAQENSPLRKPGIGMALQAKADFPEIDFMRSIMIGDSESDMEFARNAGMQGVFVGEQHPSFFSITSLAEL